MHKSELKDCILIACVSFTVAAVVLSTINYFAKISLTITNISILQLFFCNMLIAVLIYCTSKIPVKTLLVSNLIMIADIAIVIFVVGGGIFKWFSWTLLLVTQVSAALLLIFFVTNLFMTWQCNLIAEEINKKAKERDE